VTFNSNGGKGVASKQKIVITYDEDGNVILEQRPLKKTKFKNTSAGYEKAFLGWTL